MRNTTLEQVLGITITEGVNFSRPCVEGHGVAVEVLVERFNEGESIESLALDYGITTTQVQNAIRYAFLNRKAITLYITESKNILLNNYAKPTHTNRTD